MVFQDVMFDFSGCIVVAVVLVSSLLLFFWSVYLSCTTKTTLRSIEKCGDNVEKWTPSEEQAHYV